MGFICDECGTTDCDNCKVKKKKAKFTAHFFDGTPIFELDYKPNVGDTVKIDDTDKWYKIMFINNKQKFCTCRELADPNF